MRTKTSATLPPWCVFVVGLLAACSATSASPERERASGGAGGTVGFGGTGGGGGSISTGGSGGIEVGGGGSGGTPPEGEPSGNEPLALDECGSDNSAGLSDADVQRLMSGGAASAMRWLYPYGGTVFPRGLKSPLLMWEGPAATAVYVHIHSTLFDYKGCLAPTGPGQLQLPQHIWGAAEAKTLGTTDPFTIELTTLGDGTVAGPLSEQIVIAQATLKGSIYYGTYDSRLAGGIGGGAIFRLAPGGSLQYFLRQNTCTGCHSVSGNGTRLLSTEGLAGQTYNITPSTAPNPAPARAAVASSFVGLSPDGSVYLSTAVQLGLGPRNGGPIQIAQNTTLYETDTGTVIAGTGIPSGAMMPTFSPDGTLVVFNDTAIQTGRGLAVMRYDATQRRATDYRQIYVSTQAYPGWPFVLPDDHAVLFASGITTDFSGLGVGISPGTIGPASDLNIVDLQSGQALLLAQAMGFSTAQDATANQTYLPFGNEDLHQHYYPTVSPVAAGGFFWVFFDSMRHYGNLGLRRQLWGTALTISADGSYTSDPSHPAFYVGGQELETANHRAFTALDPCRSDGDACDSGVDCCAGFCTDGVCGRKDEPRCSNVNEACSTAADCCDPSYRCIAGYCSIVIPK